MTLKGFYLFLFCVVLCEAGFEGEKCTKDGVAGVCTNIKKCPSAIEDVRNKKKPQTCSFDNADPIVCCLTKNLTSSPNPGTTVNSPPVVTTIENDGCEPLPLTISPKKTGQKAFDKCIEYQQTLVYPCEPLTKDGETSRQNNCHHAAEELILGDSSAGRHELPHMVLLGFGETLEKVQWQCGGSIISENFILTAGHCYSSRSSGPVSYILIGASKKSEATDKSKIYKVKRVIKHPEFKPPSKYNDIGLIETEKQIQLDQFTVPACLDTGDVVNDEEVIFSNWGLLNRVQGSSQRDYLQKVTLRKVPTAKCSETYGITRILRNGIDEKTQICYAEKHEIQNDIICNGESGSPVQIRSQKIHCMYKVVGISSFGKPCLPGTPDVFTKINSYMAWIESIVWPN